MIADNHTVTERRTLERFDLRLSAKLETQPATPLEKGVIREVETENICSGGAFFKTLQPLVEGTRVRIEIALGKLENGIEAGKWSLVKLRGEVLRIEPKGIAVAFERPFRILPGPA